MEEREGGAPARTDLTAEEELAFFQQHLTKKSIEFKCEVCGAQDWGIVPPRDGARTCLVFGKPNYGATRFSDILTLMCYNCGNLKSFARHFIIPEGL